MIPFQLPPDLVSGATPIVTACALVIFGAERGIALWRGLAKDRKDTGHPPELHPDIKGMAGAVTKDMRNALTVHQLTLDKSLMEWRDDLRREIVEAIRDGFRGME